jgi:4-diphosphocytidyl-2C-methyl-D-erythritol kinase
MSLLRSKLKEFLDLEQGNHTAFDYTRQFNTHAQYGSYHIDRVEKKANLYRAGLAIQLQDRLVQSPNLSYNDLASVTIHQERMMKDVTKAEEKKRKRMMPGSSGTGGCDSAPPKYCMIYTPPSGQLC